MMLHLILLILATFQIGTGNSLSLLEKTFIRYVYFVLHPFVVCSESGSDGENGKVEGLENVSQAMEKAF